MRPRRGYWRSRPSCISGRPTTLIVGSMTCSTSSPIPPSLWWRGSGCGAIEEHGRPESTGWHPAPSCSEEAVPRRAARRSQGPAVRTAARAGTDDPQGRTASSGAWASRPPGTGPCKPPSSWCSSRSSRRTSSRARYGFRPDAEPRTPSPRSTRSPPARYEWVLEGDIKACFDEIDHTALLDRVRASDRGQACPGLGEGVPQGRSPLRGRHRAGHRAPAPRRAGSSRRCWPTSPCRSSTSTSPRPGRRWGDFNARSDRRRKGHGHLPARAVRRRLRRHGRRHPSSTPRRCETRWQRCLPDGPAPVGGEDDDRPHRRGLRLPRLPHPAATQARLDQAVRLHLAIEESARLDQGQGEDDHPTEARTNRSQSCCAGSTRCCGAGPTTSGTGCPKRPSATCTTSPGGG